MATVSRKAILAIGASALAAGPRAVRAQQLETLHLAGVPTDDVTPVFYALKNGMYQKAGVDLQWVQTSSGTAATTAVVTGTYELGKASPIAPILAHLRGLPIVVVANGVISTPRTPFSAMLVATDSPIRTGAECNGKIGVSPGLSDINSLAMEAWIDKNGGDSKTVKWVEVPGSAAAEAIAEHRVDFALLQEPQLSAALALGKVRVLADAYAAVSERWITSSYITNVEFAAKHADALRKFVRVTYEAAGYTNSHKSETVPMMSERTKIPLETYTKLTRGDGSTATDPALLQPIIDMAVRYKVLSRSFPAKEMYWSA
ncbi:MAG: ABC transporter substrate-binding protein [Candidatus Eremiobacteraeota bacterium]|nr:ABC transporter substrate-binding protein [Candidatus Eremiobacteraeota bacterium]